MKRWLMAPFRLLWRGTLPLRRPILAKAATFIARSTYRPPHHCLVSEETSLVMNHMVRELVRLQQQVEHLQQALDDLAPHAGGLGVVRAEDEVRSAAG